MANRIRKGPTQLYRFDPHGSRKIQDLTPLRDLTEVEKHTVPEIYCYDQEPLNYNFYKVGPVINPPAELLQMLERKGIIFPRLNFRGQVVTIWNRAVLLHSEKRSCNVDLYQATQFIPVYYWCHALIALDWFRYAQHVTQKKSVEKTFLIYNRAWAGTREYRLRFAELLIHLNLQAHCKTSVNTVEPELNIHYELHHFKNPVWRPQTVLENYFPISNAHSHYSADFDIEDYAATDIEVVLETLFDDSRLHLTEKALRPIACAQPFILAGTHGSLEYLRSYGFKTFGDAWDESYDLVEDPAERLIQIAELMKQIATWTPEERANKMALTQSIAVYNQQHFFSDKFFNLINNELNTNLTSALTELENTNTSSNYLHRHNIFVNDPELHQLGTQSKKAETIKQRLVLAHHYNNRNK